jgi:hypothetical protein
MTGATFARHGQEPGLAPACIGSPGKVLDGGMRAPSRACDAVLVVVVVGQLMRALEIISLRGYDARLHPAMASGIAHVGCGIATISTGWTSFGRRIGRHHATIVRAVPSAHRRCSDRRRSGRARRAGMTSRPLRAIVRRRCAREMPSTFVKSLVITRRAPGGARTRRTVECAEVESRQRRIASGLRPAIEVGIVDADDVEVPFRRGGDA